MKYILLIILFLYFPLSSYSQDSKGTVNNIRKVDTNNVSIFNIKIQNLEKEFVELKNDVKREFDNSKAKYDDLKWTLQVFITIISLALSFFISFLSFGLTFLGITVSIIIYILNKQSKASIKNLKEDTEKELSAAKDEILNKVKDFEILHEQAKANVDETLKNKHKSEVLVNELTDTVNKTKETTPELKAEIESAVSKLEETPDNKLSVNELYLKGYNLGEKDNHPGAIYYYTKAIEAAPNFASAYNNRGFAFSKMGNIKEAMINYSKAIELKPSFLYYNNRASLYLKLKKYDIAIEDIKKSNVLNPSEISFLNLSELYIFTKEYHLAKEYLNKLDDTTAELKNLIVKYFLLVMADKMLNLDTRNSLMKIDGYIPEFALSEQNFSWEFEYAEEWLKDNPDIPEDKRVFIQNLIDKLKKLK